MPTSEDVYEALGRYLSAAAEAAAAPVHASARLRALVEQRRLEYQNLLEACMLELVGTSSELRRIVVPNDARPAAGGRVHG